MYCIFGANQMKIPKILKAKPLQKYEKLQFAFKTLNIEINAIICHWLVHF